MLENFRIRSRPVTFRRASGWGYYPADVLARAATSAQASISWSKGAVAAAAGHSDQDLGNVMGLNPFHDYAAWDGLRRLQALGIVAPDNADPKSKLKQIEMEIRSQFQASVCRRGAARCKPGPFPAPANRAALVGPAAC